MLRIAAVLATAALAVVPLAGCGEDDINPDALANAAEATRKQGGVHMTMNGTVEAQGQKIPMKMEGDADLAKLAMHAKTQAGGGIPEIEMVMLGTTMYMKMPGLEQAFDGAEWIKMDLQKVGEEMGVDFAQLMQMGQSSPAEQLKYLKAMSDLEELGTETIDGVETTHYKGVVDLRKYPDTLPEGEREQARRNVDKLIELAGTSTTPTEVWIDEDSLVRRQKMTMSQKKPVETKTEMDVRYTDFGKDVDIQAPENAKDVTDLATKGIAGG
ncbi:MAG TPA: LppX_LprAFG lipoprotein [Solirubrobacteraceae bacterium]|jgi:outer membrane lipoprotein-sorting protein